MVFKTGESHLDISQFLLRSIWSCDAVTPIVHEQKYLMDYNKGPVSSTKQCNSWIVACQILWITITHKAHFKPEQYYYIIIVRPSDRVRLKNANYANFLGEIVRLERPIVR